MKLTTKNIFLLILITLFSESMFSQPGPPGGAPDLDINTNLIILFLISLIFSFYKLRKVTKKPLDKLD